MSRISADSVDFMSRISTESVDFYVANLYRIRWFLCVETFYRICWFCLFGVARTINRVFFRNIGATFAVMQDIRAQALCRLPVQATFPLDSLDDDHWTFHITKIHTMKSWYRRIWHVIRCRCWREFYSHSVNVTECAGMRECDHWKKEATPTYPTTARHP